MERRVAGQALDAADRDENRLSKAQMEGLAELISDFFNSIGHQEKNYLTNVLSFSTISDSALPQLRSIRRPLRAVLPRPRFQYCLDGIL